MLKLKIIKEIKELSLFLIKRFDQLNKIIEIIKTNLLDFQISLQL